MEWKFPVIGVAFANMDTMTVAMDAKVCQIIHFWFTKNYLQKINILGLILF